jgi:hypothetical protein
MHKLFHYRLRNELIEPRLVQCTLASHRAGRHDRVAWTLFGPQRIPSLGSSLFDQAAIRAAPAGQPCLRCSCHSDAVYEADRQVKD